MQNSPDVCEMLQPHWTLSVCPHLAVHIQVLFSLSHLFFRELLPRLALLASSTTPSLVTELLRYSSAELEFYYQPKMTNTVPLLHTLPGPSSTHLMPSSVSVLSHNT